MNPFYGELFDGPIQLRWNASSIKAMQKCPRYYQLSIVLGYAPESQSVHLWFGAHYADSIELYYRIRHHDIPHDDALHVVTWRLLLDTLPVPEFRDPKYKSRPNLVRSVVNYLDTYKTDEERFPIVTTEAYGPATELVFELPLPSGVSLVGRLDRLVKFGGDNLILDNKTTGMSLSPYYFSQFKPDVQTGLYVAVGQIVYDTPVSGMMIDAAQILQSETRYARDIIYYTASEAEEVLTETEQKIAVWNEVHNRAGWYPMNQGSCLNFGKCEFHAVCSSAPEIRPAILATEYKKKEY